MAKKVVPYLVHGDKPLAFHPLADIFPLMEGDAFAALVADVREHGVRERITLFEDMILDGRNRYRAWQECEGHTCDWHIFPSYGDTPAKRREDALAFVISANIHRRHLTAEQKRDLIAKLLKNSPEKSDRQIAKEIGASHTHVSNIRDKLEETGDVATVATSPTPRGASSRGGGRGRRRLSRPILARSTARSRRPRRP
jgi:ParB-like chromosome segregation protein Spo0J